jgi:hypothetical protein
MTHRLFLACALAAALLPGRALAQTAAFQDARDRGCTALNCAEQSVILVALDSVFAARAKEGAATTAGLRIWKTVHRSPFRMEGTLSPPVDVIRQFDISFLRRRWPQTVLVDSAQAVQPSGATLHAGGPVVILAPVEWMGTDVARVRFALYLERIDYGEEWYVRVHWDRGQWRVAEVKGGWAN